MKYYDITQEVFSCCVYGDDPAPKRDLLASLEAGDICDVTAFSMCAHNGTHLDAPRHFIKGGKTVDELSLSQVIGRCCVVSFDGVITAKDASLMMARAKESDEEAAKRILVKGKAELSYEAAEVILREGVILFGNESQTVGPEKAPLAVHKLLLGEDIVLLEGVRLSAVPDGVYFLFAAPLLLGGAEGAPCRAVLIDDRSEESIT